MILKGLSFLLELISKYCQLKIRENTFMQRKCYSCTILSHKTNPNVPFIVVAKDYNVLVVWHGDILKASLMKMLNSKLNVT